MVFYISKHEISTALPKIQEGLNKYIWLQSQVKNERVFHENAEFRRRFNHFYRVRRGRGWQEKFYTLMSTALNENLTFDVILEELKRATSRTEASFASKLYATINPSAPVIDSIVLRNMGLRLPYAGARDRISRICQIHATLERLFDAYLQTENGLYLVNEFNQMYPEVSTKVTEQKKLDLVLWQTR